MPIRLDTPTTTTTLNWLGNEIRLPIRATETEGQLSGQLAVLSPGSGNPPHVHTRESECFVVLEGEIELKYGAGSTTLGPGDLAYLPAGLPHQLSSSPTLKSELLVLMADGNIEQAFVQAAAATTSDKMKAIFAKFGVELLDQYDATYRPAGFESVGEESVVIRRQGTGSAVWLAGDTYTILLTGNETEDRLAVVHFDIPPGGGPLPHEHSRDFEAFVIIQGEVELYADGEILTGKKGDIAILPPNIPHSFKNRTNQNSQMIAVVTPAGFDRFIIEVGKTPIAGQSPPPIDLTEKKKLVDTAPRYGLTLRPDLQF